jgi:hypothetical protein
MLLDSFWRAAVYCLHPRVIALSFLPFAVIVALSLGLGYLFWEPSVTAVSSWLTDNEFWAIALDWLDKVGAGSLRAVLAPLVILFLATPVIVLLSLLLVGWMMTPAIVALVADRRFADLERKRGASWLGSAWWTLLSTVMALLALLASLPLWLIPPLIMVLPPLIWGWLTYRIFTFDALAEHASVEERTLLFERHRHQFLLLGVGTGYLGALPSVLWASGAMFIAMAPVLIPLAIWLYTLIFAFSSLWFTHFALAALTALRRSDQQPKPGFASARAAVLPAAADAANGSLDVVDVPSQGAGPHDHTMVALPPPAPAPAPAPSRTDTPS